MISLTKVYPQLERITRVAKSASGFHQVVLKRTDLIVIAALSQRLTLLLLSTGDQWQRRRNKLLRLSEAIKASQLLLREDINQATPRHQDKKMPLHQLFSSLSLAMNLLPLPSRQASLDRQD